MHFLQQVLDKLHTFLAEKELLFDLSVMTCYTEIKSI